VFDDKQRVEVLADRQIILDGQDGEEFLKLTTLAWGQGIGIMMPLILSMLLILYFMYIIQKVFVVQYDGRTSYTYYLSSGGSSVVTETTLIIAAVVLGVVLLIIFLFYKYREACERLFRRFLVLDFLLIYAVGGGVLIFLLAVEWRVPLSAIDFFVGAWNFGMLGLYSLYYPVPENLHRFYIIMLHLIMAVLILGSLGKWLMFFFITVAALADVLADCRPNVRFVPFILPTAIQLATNVPRLFYHVGTLRLRPVDLMWYGSMVAMVSPTMPSVLLAMTLCLAVVALFVFVLPYHGRTLRPLPLAFLLCIIVMLCGDLLMLPTIRTSVTVLP